jgi:hypothetical protein
LAWSPYESQELWWSSGHDQHRRSPPSQDTAQTKVRERGRRGEERSTELTLGPVGPLRHMGVVVVRHSTQHILPPSAAAAEATLITWGRRDREPKHTISREHERSSSSFFNQRRWSWETNLVVRRIHDRGWMDRCSARRCSLSDDLGRTWGYRAGFALFPLKKRMWEGRE